MANSQKKHTPPGGPAPHDPFFDLLAGTTAETGESFFQNFVRHLAQTYRAQFALVTELLEDDQEMARTLAFFAHGNSADNFEYALQDTPCECVYQNGLSYFANGLQEQFSKDTDLVDMGVNSYLGMPLYAKDGAKIGHICVLGINPLADNDYGTDYMQIFASRAGAELERIKADRKLLEQRDMLTQMVDEQTEELRISKEQAEAANRAKTEFLARMSHELKTPLHAISGFSQLMKEETAGKLNPVYREYIDSTLSASGHLKNIIDELLDFSVLEIGKLKTNIKSHIIKPIIDDSMRMVSAKASEKGVEIFYSETTDHHARILVDAARLSEIIINLLTNAIKYNHDDGKICIDIKPTSDGYHRLSVTDTGPGISKLEQARVFEEFERLDADRDCIEGTGIGLAITKRLVEHMNGRIGLESKLGRGSTFWVEFPIASNSQT